MTRPSLSRQFHFAAAPRFATSRRAVGHRSMVVLACLVVSGCRSAAAPPPVPDIPSPVHRTPTIPVPPDSVVRPPGVRELLQHVADSVINAPMWRMARWGILVVDPETGDTLVSRDADKLFIPASNQKLLTGAIALQVLGPDYRWRTPVLLRGRQVGSTWSGDLVLVGSGDPSWSDSLRNGSAMSVFDPVVTALRARGIQRIRGRVLAEGDALPGRTSGWGWEVDDLDGVPGAAVDELLFNEGTLRLLVRGGTRTGAAVHVERSPTTAYPPLIIRATTGVGNPLRAAYDSTARALVLTGTLGAGASAVIAVAYRQPNDATRAALIQHLSLAGIRVDSTGAVPSDARARADTITIIESVSLPAILTRMQKRSQNQVAELLFRTSGRVASGDGSADSARAVAARTLLQFGVPGGEATARDGSGMSRHNYLTPRSIIRVLDAMRRSPLAAAYRDALPVAGVDGTLRNRMEGTAAAGNVRAKTGTLDRANALSGHVTTADGRLLLFSIVCNNFTAPAGEVQRVQDMIAILLATARPGDVAPPR